MPRVFRVVLLLVVGSIALGVIRGSQIQAQSTTNPYRVTFDWAQLPDGREMGTVSGVFPDPDGQHL